MKDYKRIKREIKRSYRASYAEMIGKVKSTDTVEVVALRSKRFIGRDIITDKGYTVAEARAKLIARLKSERDRKIKRAIEYVDKIGSEEPAEEIRISVDWTKGGVYGMQASAEMWTGKGYYKGHRTTGCGYDKLSTAASVFRRLSEFLKKSGIPFGASKRAIMTLY